MRGGRFVQLCAQSLRWAATSWRSRLSNASRQDCMAASGADAQRCALEAALEPPIHAKKDHVCRVAARPLAGQPRERHRATNSLYFHDFSSCARAAMQDVARHPKDSLSLGSKAPRAERGCSLVAMLAADACRGIKNTLLSLTKNHKISRLAASLSGGERVFSLQK